MVGFYQANGYLFAPAVDGCMSLISSCGLLSTSLEVVTLHFALGFQIADVTTHLLVAVLPVGVQTSDRGERHLAPLTSCHVFFVFLFRLFVATLSVMLLLLRPDSVTNTSPSDARLLVIVQFAYRPEIMLSSENQ